MPKDEQKPSKVAATQKGLEKANRLDAQIELEVYEAETDDAVKRANEVVAAYDTLQAVGKALTKVDKPSGDTLEAAAPATAGLDKWAAKAFDKWQRGDLEPKAAIAAANATASAPEGKRSGSQIAGKASKATPAPPTVAAPGKGVLPLLVAREAELARRLGALETATSGAKLGEDVEKRYLDVRRALVAVIARIEPIEAKDLQTEAGTTAKAIDVLLDGLAKGAKTSLDAATKDAMAEASRGPGPFKAFLGNAVGPLTFAARSAEADALLKKGGATLDPAPSALLSSGRQLILQVEAASGSLAQAFDRSRLDAEDLLRRLEMDPRALALDARAQAKLFSAQVKPFGEAQAALADLADKLRAKPLSAVGEGVKSAVDALAEVAAAMNLTAARQEIVVQGLNGSYLDNIAGWTSAEINLYYFEDVERLLRMLTPNIEEARKDETAQADSRSQTVTALRAREALANATANRADAQRRLDAAKEDLRLEGLRAERERARQNAAVQAASGRVEETNDDVIAAQEEVDKAQADATAAATRYERAKEKVAASPNDPALQSQAEAASSSAIDAKRLVDLKTARLTALRTAQTNATARQTTENGKLSALQDKVATLEQTVDTAAKDEQAKTTEYRSASTAALVEAFLANQKFAQSVERRPFFVTKRDAFLDALKNSSDPVSRVLLYGEPMEKRIVIRGRADDVQVVRDLIALIDTPQAQSDISVFTAELSSRTGTDYAIHVQQAMRALDTTLNQYSQYNDAAQALIRKALIAVVDDAVKGNRFGPPTTPPSKTPPPHQPGKRHHRGNPSDGTPLSSPSDFPSGGDRFGGPQSQARTRKAMIREVLIRNLGFTIAEVDAVSFDDVVGVLGLNEKEKDKLKALLTKGFTVDLGAVRQLFKEKGSLESLPAGDVVEWVSEQDPKLLDAILTFDPRVLDRLRVAEAIRDRWPEYGRLFPDLSSPASLAEATLGLALLRRDLRESAIATYLRTIETEFGEAQSGFYVDLGTTKLHLPARFVPTAYLRTFLGRGLHLGSAKIEDKIETLPNGGEGATSDPVDADLTLLQDAYVYGHGIGYMGRVRATLDRA